MKSPQDHIDEMISNFHTQSQDKSATSKNKVKYSKVPEAVKLNSIILSSDLMLKAYDIKNKGNKNNRSTVEKSQKGIKISGFVSPNAKRLFRS